MWFIQAIMKLTQKIKQSLLFSFIIQLSWNFGTQFLIDFGQELLALRIGKADFFIASLKPIKTVIGSLAAGFRRSTSTGRHAVVCYL